MATILIIANNKKERDILNLAFEQNSYRSIVSATKYSNYVKSLQYNPDIILMEIPSNYLDQLSFARLVKKNKSSASTPVIGYGDEIDERTEKMFLDTGLTSYVARPLKIKTLLEKSEELLAKFKKNIKPTPPKAEEPLISHEFLLDKSKQPMEKIDAMVNAVGKLLAFPFTIAKVLKITQDEKSGAGELSKAIQLDPAISATILKVSNSVLFASRDRQISDIKEAIVRIGFKESKNISMGLSVMKLFTKGEKSMGFDRLEFWYHSLCCGVIAEKLAKNAGYASPEEAFLCGLLHDFGIMIFDEYFYTTFEKIMAETTKNGIMFIKAAENLMGVTHNDVAEGLFNKWKIPERVTAGLKHQHNYHSVKDEHPADFITLIKSVGIANIISKSIQIGRECDNVIYPVSNTLMEEMRFAHGIHDSFYDEIYTQINMYNKFLNLDNRTYPIPPDKNIKEENKLKVAFVDREKNLFHSIPKYLSSQNYRVTRFSPSQEIPPNSDDFDAIIINTSKEENAEAIRPYITMPKKTKSTQEAEQKFIPAIILTENGLEPVGSKSFKKLPKIIDLRTLDFEIEKLLNMKQIEGIKIFHSDEEKHISISIAGSIKLSAIPELKNYFLGRINDGAKNIVLDLEDVDYMDSSGIGLIVNFFKKLKASSGNLVLYKPSDDITKVLTATNLQQQISIIRKEEELEKVFK